MSQLTVTLDDDLLQAAQAHARQHGQELDALVARLLAGAVRPAPADAPVASPPPVKTLAKRLAIISQLAGSLKAPADFDYRKELEDGLAGKYGARGIISWIPTYCRTSYCCATVLERLPSGFSRLLLPASRRSTHWVCRSATAIAPCARPTRPPSTWPRSRSWPSCWRLFPLAAPSWRPPSAWALPTLRTGGSTASPMPAIEGIVTRDPRGFAGGTLPVLSPAQAGGGS